MHKVFAAYNAQEKVLEMNLKILNFFEGWHNNYNDKLSIDPVGFNKYMFIPCKNQIFGLFKNNIIINNDKLHFQHFFFETS